MLARLDSVWFEDSEPFVVEIAKHPKVDPNLLSEDDKCVPMWYALTAGNNNFIDALLSNNKRVKIDIKLQGQTMLNCTSSSTVPHSCAITTVSHTSQTPSKTVTSMPSSALRSTPRRTRRPSLLPLAPLVRRRRAQRQPLRAVWTLTWRNLCYSCRQWWLTAAGWTTATRRPSARWCTA